MCKHNPAIPFKKLNIELLEETDHIFGLADETKSYPVGIVKDVEVHIGKLKLLNDFYVINMKKDPETPLLLGRGFLATVNAVIDYRKAKIAVGEGITSSKGVEARTPYYARKDILYCHFLGEWEIARDAEINPFKDVLVFRRMVEFLEAIPINLKRNMCESEDLIQNQIVEQTTQKWRRSMLFIQGITYIIACRKFFKEKEKKIFLEAGDDVRIYPNGVVIFDEKKLGTTAASPAVEAFVNLTDKSGSDKAYHAVSPPLSGNFLPGKPDLTFINEIIKSENLDVTTVVTPSNEKTVENKDCKNAIDFSFPEEVDLSKSFLAQVQRTLLRRITNGLIPVQLVFKIKFDSFGYLADILLSCH
ncbi:putative reverse transcriptase domain-containing protein [Tanacetum coccineum]